ncbi:MAG: hypothetical protein K9K67_03025 [Bacteriovoracaceae bacterium]|nr:hypothetical protein [Bacteriovoracaceae bacterium]
MGNKKIINFLKNQKGQSTVEYVLLLVVVVSVFLTVFNSRKFQAFFGEDSDFFTAIAQKMKQDYRYATNVSPADDVDTSPVPNHPSFAQPDGSASRFFGYAAGEGYPPN